MSDLVPPGPDAAAGDSSASKATVAALPAATAAKRPGPIRSSAVIVLVLLALIAVASVPLVVEPWIVGQIRSQLVANGYEIDPATRIEVDAFNGRMHFAQLVLFENYQSPQGGPPERRQAFAADELDADLALADCLGGDLVFDALVATGAVGNLRRRADGTIPVITPTDGDGIDWGKLDWWSYYEKLSEWYRKRQDQERQEQEEEAKKPPEQRRRSEPEPAPEWPEAKVYKPTPKPGQRGPRVLVRRLEISFKGLGLPDETPFDVVGGTLTGSNVTLTQLPDEKMTLAGTLQTKGAGSIDLDLARDPGATGRLSLKANELPLATLTDAEVSGAALAQYGPSGMAKLDLACDWQDLALTGALTSVLTGFDLNPQPGAGGEAQQAALVVKKLKGQPIAWPMRFGGTLLAPRVTDSGVDELVKGSVAGAVKDAAVERGKEEAGKMLEKQGVTVPDPKKATDLLKGLGK